MDMTREESWQVEGVTLTLLRHVTSLGYTVMGQCQRPKF
jgi:hypothetical protein